MINQNETWKDVEGFEGLYRVSDLGNVISCQKKVLSRERASGVNTRTVKSRILKPDVSATGYLRVTLATGGLNQRFLLHRVVAKMFIANPFNLRQVNHINGMKSDNRVVNLEWSNCSDNNKHAFATGLRTPNRGSVKYSNETLGLIKSLVQDGMLLKDVASKMSIPVSTISSLKRRQFYDIND